MARIIWTSPALANLQAVTEYIELDKPKAAKKLAGKIFSTVTRLQDFPQLGKLSKEKTHTVYRELVIVPCRIFYRIDEDVIYIVTVLRMEREI